MSTGLARIGVAQRQALARFVSQVQTVLAQRQLLRQTGQQNLAQIGKKCEPWGSMLSKNRFP